MDSVLSNNSEIDTETVPMGLFLVQPLIKAEYIMLQLNKDDSDREDNIIYQMAIMCQKFYIYCPNYFNIIEKWIGHPKREVETMPSVIDLTLANLGLQL